MEDLRRRADSPNLQFDVFTLPAWRGARREEAVRQHFAAKSQLLDTSAIAKLAGYTGGEPAFLSMLEKYLKTDRIKAHHIERAVSALLREASDYEYLERVAVDYGVDQELRRCADLLIARRQAHLKTGGLLADVDPMQLRGALVAEPATPYRYEFRNEIVRSLFEGLHDARRSVRNGNSVDPKLLSQAQNFRTSGEPRSRSDWVQNIRSVWEILHLGSLDSIESRFFHGAPVKECSEPWAAIRSDAVCELRLNQRHIEIDANILGRDDWTIELKLAPTPPFEVTVRNRHLVESWLSYVARSADRAVTLYLAEIGRSNLAREQGQQTEAQRRKVFVVYGRDSARRNAFYDFLRALKLEPIDWAEAKRLTGKAMPSVYEVIDTGMENAQACVVLLTGDDEARLRDEFFNKKTDEPREKELRPQARPNVIFEAGMALGRYAKRTVLAQFDSIRPFSDVEGFARIQYQSGAQFRNEVIQALQTAECPVDLSDPAWKTAGQFTGSRHHRR